MTTLMKRTDVPKQVLRKIVDDNPRRLFNIAPDFRPSDEAKKKETAVPA